jgi:hypothetical protein
MSEVSLYSHGYREVLHFATPMKGGGGGALSGVVRAFGLRVSGFRLQVSVFEFRVSGFCCRFSGLGLRVSDVGSRVSGSGLRVSVFGIRDSGSGFRVSGFGFWVSGVVIRDSGFGGWGGTGGRGRGGVAAEVGDSHLPVDRLQRRVRPRLHVRPGYLAYKKHPPPRTLQQDFT